MDKVSAGDLLHSKGWGVRQGPVRNHGACTAFLTAVLKIGPIRSEGWIK